MGHAGGWPSHWHEARCRAGGVLFLVAEGDFDGAGVFHQLAGGIDAAHFVDGIGDGDGAGGMVFVAHHEAEFSFFEELDGFDAEAGAEDAVEHGGGASALEVAKDAGADFLSGAVADFASNDFGNASEAVFAGGGLESADFAVPRFRSLGDDNHGALGAFLFAAQDFCCHFGKLKGNFRDENDVSTSCQTAVEGDPACVAAHDFDYHDALVTGGGGVQAVEGTGHAFDGGVEAECHVGGLKVVVDGLWNSDNRQARVVHLECGIQGSVAADDDEAVEIQRLECLPCFSEHLGRYEGALATIAARNELAFVDGAEEGASEVHDACGGTAVQHDMGCGLEETFKAILKSDQLPAEFFGGAAGGAEHGVEAGAVAAAGENSNAFALHVGTSEAC